LEIPQMTNRQEHHVRAERDDIDCLVALLAPLEGAIWLATDVATQIHWTIAASSVDPVADTPDGRFCRAHGLLTVSDCDHAPVFMINEGDSLHWIEENQILAVRELGEASCEIRLERLVDLDAEACDLERRSCRPTADLPSRTITLGTCRHLQIYDDQLPTGVDEVDERLNVIESTIGARRQLFGPATGTLDVLVKMERDLIELMRTQPVRSFVWAAVLHEQISLLRQALCA
jgi:hypothetical protein